MNLQVSEATSEVAIAEEYRLVIAKKETSIVSIWAKVLDVEEQLKINKVTEKHIHKENENLDEMISMTRELTQIYVEAKINIYKNIDLTLRRYSDQGRILKEKELKLDLLNKEFKESIELKTKAFEDYKGECISKLSYYPELQEKRSISKDLINQNKDLKDCIAKLEADIMLENRSHEEKMRQMNEHYAAKLEKQRKIKDLEMAVAELQGDIEKLSIDKEQLLKELQEPTPPRYTDRDPNQFKKPNAPPPKPKKRIVVDVLQDIDVDCTTVPPIKEKRPYAGFSESHVRSRDAKLQSHPQNPPVCTGTTFPSQPSIPDEDYYQNDNELNVERSPKARNILLQHPHQSPTSASKGKRKLGFDKNLRPRDALGPLGHQQEPPSHNNSMDDSGESFSSSNVPENNSNEFNTSESFAASSQNLVPKSGIKRPSEGFKARLPDSSDTQVNYDPMVSPPYSPIPRKRINNAEDSCEYENVSYSPLGYEAEFSNEDLYEGFDAGFGGFGVDNTDEADFFKFM